ncbi:hypothetical protein [Deinococcus maricopensis]|uniref:Uncharacterized protein n=1 Tax=Deinococcus maricopensis (strain DSM 21211 / LMG 22137 / NRRL B-23946 / LB-34) TaxID=709986 RepID=E8U3W7_DEIML|nr:hypothetical protein [Deinococcus maricopensis]ADV68810.1 hypothetical protein Deima_3182 [Deinococcus maricopensis DSM 21211]
MTALPVDLTDAAQASAFTACLAALHGAPAEALTDVVATLEPRAWALPEPDGAWRGVVGVRRTPAPAAELVGGVHATLDWTDDTAALVTAAHAHVGAVYAYADEHAWSLPGLERAGFTPVSQYRRAAGWPPTDAPEWPDGFTWRTLAQHPDPAALLEGLRTYEGQWGHHTVTPASAALDAWAPELSVLALDPSGQVAGVCRAALDGEMAHADAPGVRADLRAGGALRRALLLTVSALLREAGATHLTLESWGEDERVSAQDAALGLQPEMVTEILARA